MSVAVMYSSGKYGTSGEAMATCASEGAHVCTKRELVSWKGAGFEKCEWGWFAEDSHQVQVCDKCEDGDKSSENKDEGVEGAGEGAIECETGIKVKTVSPDEREMASVFCCNDIAEEQLISKGKRAWQSSTKSSSTADQALDGDATTFSETKSEKAWWEVDLGKEYLVTRVHVTAREDCCLDKLNPFFVMVRTHLDILIGPSF